MSGQVCTVHVRGGEGDDVHDHCTQPCEEGFPWSVMFILVAALWLLDRIDPEDRE